jgi:hypothetical protein
LPIVVTSRKCHSVRLSDVEEFQSRRMIWPAGEEFPQGGEAWRGQVWQGSAQPGKARQGRPRRGEARFSPSEQSNNS